MAILLIIMLGCKINQQKPSCIVSFCWTKQRTLQAGSTVLSPADNCAQESNGLDFGVVIEVIVVEDDAECVDREIRGGGPSYRRGEGARLVTHGRGWHHTHVHAAIFG